MSVRAKVAIEFGIIAVLTTGFLLLFPRRNPLVDVGLAAFALACIGLSARYTHKVIWTASPPPVTENRMKRCLAVVLWITVPPASLFLTIGGFMAYAHSGWPGVMARVGNLNMLVALGCYMPWALMQQVLLQYYLLGRLLVLFPKRHRFVPIAITGACFALVHLPDLWTAAVTVVAGIAWSTIYYRYRVLWPLALSHAVLGLTFYYGVCGQDLAAEWRGLLH